MKEFHLSKILFIKIQSTMWSCTKTILIQIDQPGKNYRNLEPWESAGTSKELKEKKHAINNVQFGT